MTLVNINYKARILDDVDKLSYNAWKPRQCIIKCTNFTLVIFPTGNCRLMGCKAPITSEYLTDPFNIKIERIQSITVVGKINESVNLYKLSMKLQNRCMFEPELFPALRMLDYNPYCVNVFSTGKIMIIGIKNLDYEKIVIRILKRIQNLVKSYKCLLN